MMIQARRLLFTKLLVFALLLEACQLPATYTPTPDVDEPVFTSAAQTIEAQLTDMVGFATQTAFAAGAGAARPAASQEAPAETLPATSTPMPTKTPLPSDTPIPSHTLEPTIAPSPPMSQKIRKRAWENPPGKTNFRMLQTGRYITTNMLKCRSVAGNFK